MRTPLILTIAVLVAALAGCAPETAAPPVPEGAPVEAPLTPAVGSEDILPLESVLKSQPGAVAQRVATTEISITYSRPVARGRVLFGELVPYGEIWHPGADRATAIQVSRDVRVDGEPLPAGKYSLWTVPTPDEWTIIFSRAADVFHQPYPGEDQDALRLTVTPEAGPHMETLAFYFPVVEGKDATLRLHWGEVMVPMHFQVP